MLNRLWCWLWHRKVTVIGPFESYYLCKRCGNEFFH